MATSPQLRTDPRPGDDRTERGSAKPTAVREPRNAVQRRLWLKFHLYIGLFAGTIFVLAGLTGSLIVFADDIDAWLNRAIMKVPMPAEAASPRPLDELLAAAQTAMPDDATPIYVTFPPQPNRALAVEYGRAADGLPDEEDRFQVFVDPYTARVTGQRPLELADSTFGGPLTQILIELHYNLLLGPIGTTLVGIVAIFLLVSVVTGIIVWWPRNGKWGKALTIKRRASGERLNFDIHKTFGIYSAVILLVILFTGVYMNLPEYVTPIIELFSPAPGWPEDVVSEQPEDGAEPITAGQAIARSEQIFNDGELMGLALPQSPEESFVIRRRAPDEVTHTYPHRQIWIDQFSGEVLAVNDPHTYSAGQKFVEWQYPLHSGEAFGLTGRLIVLATGIVPSVLYVTGFIRWLQKRRAASTKRERVAASRQG
ncbi:MAG: PepSY-associated TM helix domain-containing protein [Methylotetracoccus sp.]